MPPKKGSAKRTWVDKEDEEESQQTVPAYMKASTSVPSWATTDAQREKEAEEQEQHENNLGETADGEEHLLNRMQQAKTKRFRSEDLDGLLARSEPLLTSRSNKQRALAPVPLSVIPLPRDHPQTIQWHRNGQTVIVGGRQHLYTFFSAGGYVEEIAKVKVEGRIERSALSGGGDQVVLCTHDSYIPQLYNIATEQQTPLTFMDTRNTAIHRNGRLDHSKRNFYIRCLTTPYEAAGAPAGNAGLAPQLLALGAGSRVLVGNIASGSVIATLSLDRPVTAVQFSGTNELSVAAGPKMYVYDIRKTSRLLYSFADEGSLGITSFSSSATAMAIGSDSGIVNLYSKRAEDGGLWGLGKDGSAVSNINKVGKPIKVFKNLTTSIHTTSFGLNSRGDPVFAFSSKGQLNGVRLVVLPEGTVLPSFPPVSSHHNFIQSMAIAPTVPILSVGEAGKVTNYAM